MYTHGLGSKSAKSANGAGVQALALLLLMAPVLAVMEHGSRERCIGQPSTGAKFSKAANS